VAWRRYPIRKSEIITIEEGMNMKITVFNSSPHGEKGNTQAVVDAFAKGAREAGAEVETVFIAKKNIKPCIACMVCWAKTPGVCAIKDDMKDLLDLFLATDIVVFATPVYLDNVSGVMKNFLDRLTPVADCHIEKDENGESRHVKKGDKELRFVVISTCGYPEQSHFQVISLSFNRIARQIHGKVIAEIYRGSGILLNNIENTPLESLVNAYKKVVEKAGREIVEKMELTEETKAALNKPLVPYDLYISEANKYWDKRLAKLEAAKKKDAE
jgi:multimeric flavodoxin WrbA